MHYKTNKPFQLITQTECSGEMNTSNVLNLLPVTFDYLNTDLSNERKATAKSKLQL
jgi:hypothetical protein